MHGTQRSQVIVVHSVSVQRGHFCVKPAKKKTGNFIHYAPAALLRSSKNVSQVTETARPRHLVQKHHESKRPRTAIPIPGDDIVGNAQ
jgi:hypothetical protein